jgi:hypothetical protein
MQNFTTTRHLINALEDLCPSADAVDRMRSHPSSDELRRHWQLPVYFQLRWKEIVGRLEQKLAMAASAAQASSKGANGGGGQAEWVLVQTPAIWEAISASWDDNVYLPELGGRFLRLTMQVSIPQRTIIRPTHATTDEDIGDARGSELAGYAGLTIDPIAFRDLSSFTARRHLGRGPPASRCVSYRYHQAQ